MAFTNPYNNGPYDDGSPGNYKAGGYVNWTGNTPGGNSNEWHDAGGFPPGGLGVGAGSAMVGTLDAGADATRRRAQQYSGGYGPAFAEGVPNPLANAFWLGGRPKVAQQPQMRTQQQPMGPGGGSDAYSQLMQMFAGAGGMAGANSGGGGNPMLGMLGMGFGNGGSAGSFFQNGPNNPWLQSKYNDPFQAYLAQGRRQ